MFSRPKTVLVYWLNLANQEPKDYYEAAVALEKILSDQKLRQKMSEESVKFAKEMSWEKAATAYAEIYRTIS